MTDRELTELCGKVRDDSITENETRRLEAALRDDAEARTFYLRFLQLDALLERNLPPAEEWEAAEPIAFSPTRRRRSFGWMAAAAAIIVAVTGYFLLPSNNSEPKSKTTFATLVLAEDCRWEGKPPVEGQRVGSNRLELASGFAVVRFDGGAEAALSGPVGLEITGPASAALQQGEVVVRAEEGAEGFRLSTPRGELIDLGTEFAVRVDDDGETELHVHEGEVGVGGDFENRSDNIIEAGDAVQLRENSEAFRPLAHDAPRFAELLARAGPKEQRDRMMAYEGFHTEPGVYPPDELNLGHGWAGPWRPRLESEKKGHLEKASEEMTVAHSRMDVAWPIKGGKAGMLEMPSGPSVWIREMKKPLRTGEWSIRYFSFLVTEPDLKVGRKDDGKWERNDLRFTLRSSEEYFGESLSIGWGREQQPCVSMDHGVISKSLRRIPENTTVFCVAKIMTRKSGEDRVNFRFYTAEDELDIVEPAEWDVTLDGIALSADLDLLVLTSNSAAIRYVDEIRFGPSWRSVTPVDTPMLLSRSDDAIPGRP